MGKDPTTKGWLPGLDGLRAVSVLLVLVAHSAFTPWVQQNAVWWPEVALHGGVGVSVFFVISGFLITWLLLGEEARDGRISLRDFYVRRAFRILPPAYLYLIVIVVWRVVNGLDIDAVGVSSSIAFCRNLFRGAAHTGHFWSLSIEEQFYLVWPISLILLPPRLRLPLVSALIIASPFWRKLNGLWFGHASVNWMRTDFRADGLLMGIAVALVLSRAAWREALVRRLNRPGPLLAVTALFLLLVGFIPAVRALPLYAVWSPTLVYGSAAVLVLLLVTSTAGHLGSALDWHPLRWLGRLSYSIYLWQQVFFFGISDLFFENLPWCIFASLICAALSYYGLEVRALRWRTRFLKPPSPRVTGAAAASQG